MYNLSFAMVGEDQLLDGVVAFAIIYALLFTSRTNMWRWLVTM